MGIMQPECFEYPEEEAAVHRTNNDTFNQIDEFGYGKQPKRLQFKNCFNKNEWNLTPDSSMLSDFSSSHNQSVRLKRVPLHEQFKAVYTTYLMDKDK